MSLYTPGRELYNSFLNAFNTPSDVNEHVDTLREYASRSSSVAEFGVRGGVSTYGLIYGLTQSVAEHKKYVGVDLNYCDITNVMSKHAKEHGIEYEFIQHDSATVDIPQVDTLYIDSWHVYGHLKRELNNNHSKVNRWIIMHDTTVDAELGESIRNGWNTLEQSQKTGYPEEEIRKGLWPAVVEFLEQNPQWKLLERRTNCNGLTILERC